MSPHAKEVPVHCRPAEESSLIPRLHRSDWACAYRSQYMSKYLRARYLAKPLIRARDRRVCRRRVGDEILQVQTPQQDRWSQGTSTCCAGPLGYWTNLFVLFFDFWSVHRDHFYALFLRT